MIQKKYLTEIVLLTKTYNLQDFIDWIHWHIDIIGFQRCHIFDNESLVDIKSVCDAYPNQITYERVVGWPNQYELYNRYVNNVSAAWWVLTIDDDEFLYVSETYHHNINRFLLANSKAHPSWYKICIGWRNMFPSKYIDTRINPHMILNATGWSDEASEIWQAGNRPVKTMVNTVYKYVWADRDGQHRTHDPFALPVDQPGYTVNGERIVNSWQRHPTPSNVDLLLYHYQFKCNAEWVYKCTKRKSAASQIDWKNHPELYKRLYTRSDIHTDLRAVNLWNTEA